MQPIPGTVPLYTAVEMRTVDRQTVDEIGIPGSVLMERAGLGVAGEIDAFFPQAQRIAVICGSGNNGGDGFVTARHLAMTGRQVDVLLAEAESKIRRESEVNLEILKALGVTVERVNATHWKKRLAKGYDLIVDALLGTGASDAPRPNVEVVITAINNSGVPVVAIDVPSGIDASTGAVEGSAVQATLTVTLHGPKVGLAVAPGRFHAGRVRLVDIGIPPGIGDEVDAMMALPELLALVPPRAREGSKYDAGRVLCVGGSNGMAGAIALCTRAVMRAGAGIAWAVVPEPLAVPLDIAIPEVQVRGGIADQAGQLTVAAAEGMQELVDRVDCVVFGPGLGSGDQVSALARWAVKAAPALVLDAQGLTAFSGDSGALAVRGELPTLLTPHEGELGALLDMPAGFVKEHRLECVRRAATQTRCTVLLKGEDTIVCAPNGDTVVATSNTALATAGTGDVLAGIAGALLAKGLSPLTAGACAALAMNRSAEIVLGDGRRSLIASDVLSVLPDVFGDDVSGVA